MATIWRYPLQPTQNAANAAATGAIGTTLQSALIGAPIPQLPPVFQPGARLTLEANLEYTTTSATPTLILGFYIGSVGQAITSKTAIAVTSTMATLSTATAWPVYVYWTGTIRAVGPTSGTLHGSGYTIMPQTIASYTSTSAVANWWTMPITQALRTVSTLNFNQTNEIDFGVTWSSNTGTPTITVTDYFCELSG
jgi:hypothetical protein